MDTSIPIQFTPSGVDKEAAESLVAAGVSVSISVLVIIVTVMILVPVMILCYVKRRKSTGGTDVAMGNDDKLTNIMYQSNQQVISTIIVAQGIYL